MRLIPLGLLGLALTSCGFDDDDKSAPPPITAGDSDTVFSLESGTYYVSNVRDLQDGCGKNPMAAGDNLTTVPFTLTNDGQANVTIDFCSYDGRSVQGVVRGNTGTLTALHHNRKAGAAVFDQDCRIDVTTTVDNQFTAKYVETQRNRNDAMRDATVDVPECTTSFSFTMSRKS